MAAPTFTLSEQNGSGAGSVTDTITSIVFASADLNSNTGSLATGHPITAGNNSYEKYNKLKVTGTASNSLSAFGAYFSSTAPTDQASSSSFITMYFSTNASYVAPVATVSSVATTLCSTVTTSGGATSLTYPANSVNAYSGYITQQMQTASGATGGNVTFASPWLNVGYTYS